MILSEKREKDNMKMNPKLKGDTPNSFETYTNSFAHTIDQKQIWFIHKSMV